MRSSGSGSHPIPVPRETYSSLTEEQKDAIMDDAPAAFLDIHSDADDISDGEDARLISSMIQDNRSLIAQAAVSDFKADTLTMFMNCTICFEPFLSPVSLHCGHTFCRMCLLSTVRSSGFHLDDCPDDCAGAHCKCPVCRTEFSAPSMRVAVDLNHLATTFHQPKTLTERREALWVALHERFCEFKAPDIRPLVRLSYVPLVPASPEMIAQKMALRAVGVAAALLFPTGSTPDGMLLPETISKLCNAVDPQARQVTLTIHIISAMYREITHTPCATLNRVGDITESYQLTLFWKCTPTVALAEAIRERMKDLIV
jgi:hypothetical protein